jgi:hypothetical protein
MQLRLVHAATLTLALLGIVACNEDDGPIAPTPVLTNISISVGAGTLEVGEMTSATAVGLDQNGEPMTTAAASWVSDEPSIAAIQPASGLILAIAPGTTRIRATIDGRVGERMLTVQIAPAVRINEIQPRGDDPTGWLEFANATDAPVDISGWTLIDANFFGPQFRFAAGTVIPARGLLVVEESALPFGVDANDALHLFSKFGVQVDQAVWAGQITPTLGRCPDGTGGFVRTNAATKGTPNACPPDVPPSQ